ncbi:tail fiber protein [Maricaulis sp.]|uniref:phage tail protein n=1 Tax=Maricaulis sp. TaxID=1486257 RepID=UPI0025B8564F|nr:tail fiber protein [Maricaulis sp.]
MKHMIKTAIMAAALAAPGLGAGAQAQASPTMGDIIVVGFNFCPRSYMDAHGQILPINQYQALYSLFGTTYGGDGRTTFALPDLRGRTAVNHGQGPGLPAYIQGQRFGSESVTLLQGNLAQHNHLTAGTHSPPNEETPGGNTLASFPAGNIYTTGALDQQMANTTVSHTGGDQPVQVSAPSMTLRYCVAVQGLFPSRP